jgi:AAT family amino acid transporter
MAAFPAGIAGCLLSMQMVVYAYVGVEMIGITAGEAESPQTTIPMAIDCIHLADYYFLCWRAFCRSCNFSMEQHWR